MRVEARNLSKLDLHQAVGLLSYSAVVYEEDVGGWARAGGDTQL